MDLGTVLNKLKRGEYNSPAEMAADVRLTFDNAMKYNRDDSSIHQISKNLKAVSILIPLSQTETNTQNCFQLFTTISLFFLCLFRIFNRHLMQSTLALNGTSHLPAPTRRVQIPNPRALTLRGRKLARTRNQSTQP